jgi:hypothetical protein
MTKEIENLEKYKEFSLLNPSLLKRAFFRKYLFPSYGSNYILALNHVLQITNIS